MRVEHASLGLIGRYVQGEDGIPSDDVWALESHLEWCAVCRDRLAGLLTQREPAVTSMLDGVWSILEPATAKCTPTPARHRWSWWVTTWASPAMMPWLGMTVLVAFAALVIGRLIRVTDGSAVVLLLAPIVPLLGVAASWARGLDPAYELAVASPRAGLYLVLRRTLAVLLVVIPVLLVAGSLTHTSFAQWLLPCLAFTAGTLALGTVIGVSRAALVLATLWTVLVVAPSVVDAEVSRVLDPGVLPFWGAAFVAAVFVVMARGGAYTRLDGQR